jgi:hypothetical protein
MDPISGLRLAESDPPWPDSNHESDSQMSLGLGRYLRICSGSIQIPSTSSALSSPTMPIWGRPWRCVTARPSNPVIHHHSLTSLIKSQSASSFLNSTSYKQPPCPPPSSVNQRRRIQSHLRPRIKMITRINLYRTLDSCVRLRHTHLKTAFTASL